MDEARKQISHNVTLTQHILKEARNYPESTGQLTILLGSIESACKYISSKVRAAGLFKLYGENDGAQNTTGDTVKKLDVITNDAFITALQRSHTCCALGSEENEEAILIEDPLGDYIAFFDPLDGSSNIEANVSIGTIFGLYKRPKGTTGKVELKDILQKGTDLVAAGYCMYGSATMMVICTGTTVDGFTLDPTTGEFVLSHPNIRVPESRNIYSVNEGNSKYWHDDVLNFVKEVKNADPKPHSLRYVGSMVADVHRTLLYGGIFMYPGDKKSPNGKLRLLYESNPMSFLCEKAGGKSIWAKGKRVLEIEPKDIHQRCPIFIGSTKNVELLESFME